MKQLMDKGDYPGYLEKQWKEIPRSYELKLFSKHAELIDIYLQHETRDLRNLKVLCVGARYGVEMMVFKEFGFNKDNINGLDIHPRSKTITKGDMHDMPFPDSSFDVIYSHHSLDHSLYPQRAISEFSRVSKKDAIWILSVPFNDFGKEESIDFDSPDEVKEFLMASEKEVVYELEVSRNEGGFVIPATTWLPVGWKNELRLVLRLLK